MNKVSISMFSGVRMSKLQLKF